MVDSSRGRNLVGTLTIVLTLLCWTSVPLFLRHFADAIDLWTSNGWRYGFSALLWAPTLIIASQRSGLPKGLWRAALVPSIINSAGQVCFVSAVYLIEPGLLTFTLRGQMLFVAVGAYIMFPAERPIIRSAAYLVGLVALMGGTTGAVLLGDEPLRGGHAFGVAMGVLAGALFACYGISVRKYMDRFNSVISFAAISQYTAAAMVALMLIVGERSGAAALDMPIDQFSMLLLSAVLGIAIGHVLYYLSIARLGVAVSSGVLQLHPFGVSVGSYLLFAEVLKVHQWIAGCIAVTGALLMLSVQRRISRRQAIDTTELAIAEGESGS
jgi:drug/metabolite transporter (DMT)-like permease